MKSAVPAKTIEFTKQAAVLVSIVAASVLYFWSTLYVVSAWFAESRLLAWIEPLAPRHMHDLAWRAIQQFCGLVVSSLPFAGVILWARRRNWLTISSVLPVIGLTVVIVPSSYEAWVQMPVRHLFFSLVFIFEYLVTLPLVTGLLFWLTASKHDD